MDLKKAYDIATTQLSRFLSQRLTSFNYSLILFGLLTSALINLWTEVVADGANIIYSILTISISCVISMLAFLFYGVDARTLVFLKDIEDLLMLYEDAMLNGDTTTDLLYFSVERKRRISFDKDKTPFYSITKKKIAGFAHAFVKPKLGSLIHFTYVAFFILGILSVAISIWIA